jgi:hypothetical protein
LPFGIPAAANIHDNDTRRAVGKPRTEAQNLLSMKAFCQIDAGAGVPPGGAHKRVTEIRDRRRISDYRNRKKRGVPGEIPGGVPAVGAGQAA